MDPALHPALPGAADAAALFDLPRAAQACRMVVAMSGGVDSSVVAALAAASGAEVIGVTLQLYDYGAATGRKGACCAGDDIRDARAVADRLGFAHYVFDHESAFRDEVVERFADDYLAGRTPIPCIRCNMGPKFTDLLRMARELGADCLATGHYVRRIVGRGRARAAPRARSGARPVVLPLRHDRGAARLPALPARRTAQGRGAADRRGLRPRGGGQARQPGHLLRARRRLRADRPLGPARRRAARANRPCRDRRGARRACRGDPLHRRPAARARDRRAARAALRRRRSTPPRPRSGSARGACWRCARRRSPRPTASARCPTCR